LYNVIFSASRSCFSVVEHRKNPSSFHSLVVSDSTSIEVVIWCGGALFWLRLYVWSGLFGYLLMCVYLVCCFMVCFSFFWLVCFLLSLWVRLFSLALLLFLVFNNVADRGGDRHTYIWWNDVNPIIQIIRVLCNIAGVRWSNVIGLWLMAVTVSIYWFLFSLVIRAQVNL